MLPLPTMFHLFTKNVSIEDIKKDALSFNPKDSASYHVAYPEFIRYFRDLDKIDKHNVVIGAHFAYGWMPTIFDFRSNEFKKVIDILNSAREGNSLDSAELETLKQCFNRSLVGTSKILHFINPEKFAIWDSKICRYLFKQDSLGTKISKPAYYLDYIKFCDHITTMPAFAEIHEIMQSKIGSKVTKFRSIEMAMYGSNSLKKAKK